VLGPIIVAGHETGPNQVGVKGSRATVILRILIVNTWKTHITILNVCLSHTDKKIQARYELGMATVTVHLLPVHLHYIIKFIKKIQNIMNSETMYIDTCILSMMEEWIKLLTSTEKEKR
jgi:hypothetical protein